MPDTQTPSDVLRSLSAPGTSDPQRRLAELGRTLQEQFSRVKELQATLHNKEMELSRREGELAKRRSDAAGQLERAETTVRQEQRGAVEMKAAVEVEKRLHDQQVAKAKEDIRAHATRMDDVRQSLDRDRAKLQKMNEELLAAREQYMTDRRELEKRFKEYQENNASLKRAVEKFEVEQFRFKQEREAQQKAAEAARGEMGEREGRLAAREQRFESARAEFSGAAQAEERRLAGEREAERGLKAKLEEMKSALDVERLELTGLADQLAGEQADLAKERKALGSRQEELEDLQTVLEAEREEVEELRVAPTKATRGPGAPVKGGERSIPSPLEDEIPVAPVVNEEDLAIPVLDPPEGVSRKVGGSTMKLKPGEGGGAQVQKSTGGMFPVVEPEPTRPTTILPRGAVAAAPKTAEPPPPLADDVDMDLWRAVADDEPAAEEVPEVEELAPAEDEPMEVAPIDEAPGSKILKKPPTRAVQRFGRAPHRQMRGAPRSVRPPAKPVDPRLNRPGFNKAAIGLRVTGVDGAEPPESEEDPPQQDEMGTRFGPRRPPGRR